MFVTEVKDFVSFLSLEQEWNSLLESSHDDTIFLRHEWFKCWWQAYGNGKELSILLFREEGKLIGISPLMISRDYFRGFPINKISFIENDETPRTNIITLHKKSEIIEAMIRYLTDKAAPWNVFIFNKIPMDTDTHEILFSLCQKKRIPVLARPSLHSPVLRINTDWDTFYKNTSQRTKKRLRYNKNRLRKQGDLSIVHITEPVETDLRDIFNIGKNCWKSEIGKSISSSTENQVFFTELASAAGTKGWLSIWLMKANHNPIAFEYHLKYKNQVYALRSEFDEEYGAYSPGSVLDSHIVQKLFLNGFDEYDMCGSDDAYKKHWTPDVREYTNILIFNKGVYPKMLRFIETKLIPYLKGIKFVSALADTLKKLNSSR